MNKLSLGESADKKTGSEYVWKTAKMKLIKAGGQFKSYMNKTASPQKFGNCCLQIIHFMFVLMG